MERCALPEGITMNFVLRRHSWSILPVLAAAFFWTGTTPDSATLHATPTVGSGLAALDDDEDGEAPKLSLRASPKVGFAPAEILFIAELRGGDDDYEDYYCATLEWDWDDDTRSQSTPDCEPYEPGVSEIRRRFSMRHSFDRGGSYDVRFFLKQRDDRVASARTKVELRGFRNFD
jgi:hypothetical protein